MDYLKDNTRIADLTVGEFTDLITGIMAAASTGRHTVFGIRGLADLLGVSVSQAKRIKASGALDEAIAQRGRTIVVDADRALRLFSRKKSF